MCKCKEELLHDRDVLIQLASDLLEVASGDYNISTPTIVHMHETMSDALRHLSSLTEEIPG